MLFILFVAYAAIHRSNRPMEGHPQAAGHQQAAGRPRISWKNFWKLSSWTRSSTRASQRSVELQSTTLGRESGRLSELSIGSRTEQLPSRELQVERSPTSQLPV